MIKSNKKLSVNFIVAFIVMIFLIVIWVSLPYLMTINALGKVAINANKYDLQSGLVEDVDWWDMPIRVTRINQVEKDCVVYIATSSGPDKIFDNDDDMSRYQINVNWSKKAGRSSGRILKQAASGLLEGMKEKSPHDIE